MKKLVKILVPFLVLSSTLISGCKNSKNEDQKIVLSYGDYHSEKVTDIDVSELEKKVNNKENFMLIVSSDTCDCSKDFKAMMENYIKEHHLICYNIQYKIIKDYASTYALVLDKSTTTFAIYKNGELNLQLHSSDKNDEMRNQDKLNAFLEATVATPKLMYINEADYDNIIESRNTAAVYFAKSTCPDCMYVNKTIIRDYVNEHKDMKTLYVLDIAQYDDGTANYQHMKDKFGLSEVNNEDYGYEVGYVPYFSLIQNGEFASGAVAFNDTINKVDDKYVVTKSYYSEERLPTLHYLDGLTGARLNLEGLEIASENVMGAGPDYKWAYENAKSYYTPLIKSFLNYSLAKVNHTIQ